MRLSMPCDVLVELVVSLRSGTWLAAMLHVPLLQSIVGCLVVRRLWYSRPSSRHLVSVCSLVACTPLAINAPLAFDLSKESSSSLVPPWLPTLTSGRSIQRVCISSAVVLSLCLLHQWSITTDSMFHLLSCRCFSDLSKESSHLLHTTPAVDASCNRQPLMVAPCSVSLAIAAISDLSRESPHCRHPLVDLISDRSSINPLTFDPVAAGTGCTRHFASTG
jgi:hypothetical protein